MGTIGHADYTADADGVNVLNFWQAQDKAQAKLKEFNERVDAPLAPYTVRKAIADYIEHLAGRPTREKTRLRLAAYVKPELADMALERVTAPDLTAWLKGMIKMPPRARTAEDAKQRNYRKVDMHDPDVILNCEQR